MKTRLPIFAALSALLLSVAVAKASGEESWEEFREKVAAACSVAAADVMEVETIRVDPFGSKSYGIAILADGAEERVCVYHKAADVAEIGEPVPPAADVVVEPTPVVEVEIVEGSRPDAAAPPADLETQVAATLAELGSRGLEIGDRAVRVSGLLAEGAATDLSGVAAGRFDCTVYWYGFLDEGVRRVGSHTCAVMAGADGSLRIEKRTGERLNAVTLKREDGSVEYLGRTFLAGHSITEYDPDRPANPENDNFGNKTGRVLADDGTLFLVSIDERGFTEPDATFFEILELVPRQ